MAPMALGNTATCKGDRPCRKAGTRQTRRTGRQPKQGTRACDVPALQAPQGSHKGHDVPACRADAVSCPSDWRPSCAVGVCEGLVCRTERGSGPGHFRPDVRPRCLVGPFDQTFGQIFGQSLSPSCGPTLGQLLQSVVWAAAQGKGTRGTGWGRKDGPGHGPCACADPGHTGQSAETGTRFRGRLDAAIGTGHQDRRPGQAIRKGGQGKRPRANGRERTLKPHGQRRQARGGLTVLSTSGPRLFAGALVSFWGQGSLSVLVACLSEEPVCRLPHFLRFLSALYQFFRQFFSFPGS